MLLPPVIGNLESKQSKPSSIQYDCSSTLVNHDFVRLTRALSLPVNQSLIVDRHAEQYEMLYLASSRLSLCMRDSPHRITEDLVRTYGLLGALGAMGIGKVCVLFCFGSCDLSSSSPQIGLLI